MPNASETAAFHVRREAHQTLSQIVDWWRKTPCGETLGREENTKFDE